MLSHKILILSLFFSTTAFAYEFKAATGTTWTFDIPKGWHVIDAPDGISEGIQLRLSSAPEATWDNPLPPPGHALITIGFYLSKGDPAASALTAKMQKLGRRRVNSAVMDYKGIIVEGYEIPIWLTTNNDNPNTENALKTITSTLKVKP